jgi:hypothetical protein
MQHKTFYWHYSNISCIKSSQNQTGCANSSPPSVTTHLHQEQRQGMHGAILPSPLHLHDVVLCCTEGKLYVKRLSDGYSELLKDLRLFSGAIPTTLFGNYLACRKWGMMKPNWLGIKRLEHRFPNFYSLRPPFKMFHKRHNPPNRINSSKEIWHKVQLMNNIPL